jgi:nicotinamide phosphoribosyltransferase
MIRRICENLKTNGWSVENVVFGMGGKLLQDHNRDTQKFAMKCSYIEVNGEGRNVFKDPVTDAGKTSKKGRLALVPDVDEGYKTVPESFAGDSNLLEVVYEDGVIKRRQTFDEIRELAA